MDLSDPTRSVTPTLDGPVLAVLAAAGHPLTVGEIARLTARGSEIGVRRSCARLVEQGIVTATTMGRNTVLQLNRHHLAAGIADQLAGLRLELWRRFRAAFAAWQPAPLLACVFGSAARADGGPESDIDLLVVRPALLGEHDKQLSSRILAALPLSARNLEVAPVSPEAWHDQLDALRAQVVRWTGNSLQVIDLPLRDYLDQRRRWTPLMASLTRDAVELVSQLGPDWRQRPA